MEKIVTSDEMRRLENYVIEDMGIDPLLLMERAALFAASRVKKHSGKKVLLVCGCGNNGADGMALARILTEEGYRTEVTLVGNTERRSVLNRKQEELLMNVSRKDFCLHTLTDTKSRHLEYSVIVDGILGIGANRGLQGELAEAVEFMNRLSGYKIALDIPTGVNSDTGVVAGTAFKADETVTFGLKKTGLLLNEGRQYAGRVRVNSCGIVYPGMDGFACSAFTLGKKDVRSCLVRDPQGNKSTFGKIGILAGSKAIGGAPLLCTAAAYRCGGGYVRLCTHANHRETILKVLPETVISAATCREVEELVRFADVLCAGPGIGKDEFSRQLLHTLFMETEHTPGTIILDADALNLIAADDRLEKELWAWAKKVNVILTPHLLEFSRLSGLSVADIREKKINVARKYAHEKGCTLVLKDAQTVVADAKGNLFIYAKGNCGMAVAGSGDVLAGILSGLAGQIKDPYIAACCGVYIHGMSGNRAARQLGSHSMLPTDMIKKLQKCMKKLGKEAEENGTV